MKSQGKKLPVIVVSTVLMAFGAFVFWGYFRPQEMARHTVVETPTQSLRTSPAASTKPITVPPSFDVVRVDAQGNLVIAGRAQPRSLVIVADGEKKIGEVTADDRGEWVLVPDQPLLPGRHDLDLRSTVSGGSLTTEGNEPVVLVVPEHPGQTVLAIKQLANGASTILQGPSTMAEAGPLTIGTVDYDDGHLSVSGKAQSGALLRVYLDNQLIGKADADSNGNWLLPPQPATLAAGSHSLRADQLGQGDRVAFRVEVSFLAGPTAPAATVSVEPGNSLWRIARHRYGRGEAYTLIYQANKAHIRDPNLIYPGQIFTLPKKASDQS